MKLLLQKDETFRKYFYDMTEMVKVLFEEINACLQGESSNPPNGNEDSGDKNPKGNGGNGDTPPPSPPSYTSSTISQAPLNFPKEHGEIPLQTPLLKLNIKFEFPMYNGEVNDGKLDNWIRQIEVNSRIQRIKYDETKIHLAFLILESVALIWWEAKTQEDMKKHGKVLSSWSDFIFALKR
jgi:hypothetical protein